MRKLIKGAFLLFFVSALSTGCKLDKPEYGLLASGKGTYTINGATTTRNNLSFVVNAAGQDYPASVSIGNDVDFGILCDATGTEPVDAVLILGDYLGSGKVTFTSTGNSSSKGTYKGTFTGEVIVPPSADSTIAVTGTFDITQE
jgi:hypothetical protein